jgi:hypothetical protein
MFLSLSGFVQFSFAFQGTLYQFEPKMIGSFAFIERHLDKVPLGFEMRDQKMIERVQPSRCPLYLVTFA